MPPEEIAVEKAALAVVPYVLQCSGIAFDALSHLLRSSTGPPAKDGAAVVPPSPPVAVAPVPIGDEATEARPTAVPIVIVVVPASTGDACEHGLETRTPGEESREEVPGANVPPAIVPARPRGAAEGYGGGAEAARAWTDARVSTSPASPSEPRPLRRTTARWESLTETELQVALLAAEGLTNRQIGERLFISRRTAETHLAHVYRKLGVSGRAQLAGEAARRTG